MIKAGHKFAHVTTALLSWHVQNCDLINSFFFTIRTTYILTIFPFFFKRFGSWAHKTLRNVSLDTDIHCNWAVCHNSWWITCNDCSWTINFSKTHHIFQRQISPGQLLLIHKQWDLLCWNTLWSINDPGVIHQQHDPSTQENLGQNAPMSAYLNNALRI